MEIGNVTKAATFKSSLHQRYKSTQLSFGDSAIILLS